MPGSQRSFGPRYSVSSGSPSDWLLSPSAAPCDYDPHVSDTVRKATPLNLKRAGRKALVVLAVASVLVVVGSGPASAHVTVGGNATKGGFGQFAFSVPNEKDDDTTVKLQVQLPPDQPLAFASAQAKPGWTVEVKMRTLDKPIKNDDGDEVTEAVDTITWSGGSIGAGQFDTFAVSAGPFPEDADEMVFKAIQTYGSGEEVAWIEPTPASGEEPEHPAPVLKLAAAVAEGDEAAPAKTDAAPAAAAKTVTTKKDDNGPGPVAIAALVVALAALGVGGVALLGSRKQSTAKTTA
jgi:uncharacterized protein YcnI